MFNMGPKQMEKMMKQMGIKQEQVDAEEVIIKTRDKEIVVSNPQVTKIKMGGNETFQVIGEVSERGKGFSEEDIKMVIDQTGASEDEVKKSLEETKDIAKTIMELKKE